MLERITLDRKDPVRGEQAQDTVQCIGVSIHYRCQLGGRSWCVIKDIGDAEIGNDMEAAWHCVAPGKVQQGLHGV